MVGNRSHGSSDVHDSYHSCQKIGCIHDAAWHGAYRCTFGGALCGASCYDGRHGYDDYDVPYYGGGPFRDGDGNHESDDDYHYDDDDFC